MQFSDYVDYFRPRFVVMENVVGLATYKEGETINEIELVFQKLGYRTDWKIVNAAHFGVPQRRERLILLASLDNKFPISFPTPTHESAEPTIGFRDKQRMLLPPESNLFDQKASLSSAVTVMEAIGDLPAIASGEASEEYLPANHPYQRARRRSSDKVSLHYSTAHSAKMLEIIKHSGPNISYIPKHLISSGFSSCYSRLDADKPAVTITVNFVHPASNRCIHPYCHRALTPREGARLQGFDDDFQFCGNRSQIVKQIGNAVPPLLGTVLADHVAELTCSDS
jgi:DNA (cytosine-5)-methyltransferase 1